MGHGERRNIFLNGFSFFSLCSAASAAVTKLVGSGFSGLGE
jgi:hypothetical protein